MLPGRLFAGRAALWDAVTERVRALQQAGRPVLVGTDSVADSAALSQRLTRGRPGARGAQRPPRPARGRDRRRRRRAGAITVATNMAGRGTDIPLGPGVAALGGLHVLCCQHNASRRIDRQLVGRCARQGDPGSVETWLSLQAPLLRARLPDRLLALLGAHAGRLPGWLMQALAGLLQRLEERRHVTATPAPARIRPRARSPALVRATPLIRRPQPFAVGSGPREQRQCITLDIRAAVKPTAARPLLHRRSLPLRRRWPGPKRNGSFTLYFALSLAGRSHMLTWLMPISFARAAPDSGAIRSARRPKGAAVVTTERIL